MDKLTKARNQINEINEKMAKLFEQRLEAVKLVAEYKKERGIPVFDAVREVEVLQKCADFILNDEYKAYFVSVMQSIMDVSKNYQHRLLEGAKIAYSGVEGAFANIATRKIFPDGEAVSYQDFQKTYEAVENGECDYCVLPIENSYAGEVGQVLDLMFNGSLYVNGVYVLPISQNLLGVKGAKLSDIKKVVSHPQALSQCAEFIKKHGFEEVKATNTAVAGQNVASLNDKSVGAIASVETAQLYGLEVIEKDINESATNATRFAVFSKVKNEKTQEGSDKFLLMFSVKNEAGALAKAINVIGEKGFNMKSLKSRPMKTLDWQYYFYIEAEGDLNSKKAKEMLDELKKHCQMLKIVGTFGVEENLRG